MKVTIELESAPKVIYPDCHTPDKIAEAIGKEYGHLNQEIFVVVSLNTRNAITHLDIVSIGIINAALVHPREVFRKAIERDAALWLLEHCADPLATLPEKFCTHARWYSEQLRRLKKSYPDCIIVPDLIESTPYLTMFPDVGDNPGCMTVGIAFQVFQLSNSWVTA